MSAWRLILSSLRFHWRTSLAVAAGVACATAVLTGALLVGSSVRGSLKDLVTDRLGLIDHLLVTDHFFRRELSDEVAASPNFDEEFAGVVPAILSLGTVEKRQTNRPAAPSADKTINERASGLAGSVTIVGCDDDFLSLGHGGPTAAPTGNDLVINRQLADEIGAGVGDEVILRVGRESEIPADSPLGRKTETTRSRSLTVSEIIPAQGLGRFGLSPSQQLPQVAFVDVATLQDMLEKPGHVNALLVAAKSITAASSPEASERLQANFHPRLSDFGIQVEHVIRPPPAKPTSDAPSTNKPVIDYYNLTCDRMLLPEAVVAAADRAWPQAKRQAAMTYLANEIAVGKGDKKKSVPYSIVTAIDPLTASDDQTLGPLIDDQGKPLAPLGDDEIVLNSWAAKDMGVKVGDEITVSYFEPDTTHGQVKEATATFRLVAIAPLATKDEPPRAANDSNLTPELPGVTDQASIDDWNPPFPFESERIRQQDEDYWDDHRTTPKAFVSLNTGQRLWGSRFGNTTSIRVAPAADMSVESLSAALLKELDPVTLGFALRPVKRFGLDAASGTTPFDLLFLGFSMFLIAAALMLVSLLFRLGMEQRAAEVGLMFGVGFASRRVRRMLGIEGLIVAAIGAAIGVDIGVGYAWVMLYGLRTWWVDAVSTPFLTLHVDVMSLNIGFVAGILVCWLTIAVSLRRLGKTSICSLLGGRFASSASRSDKAPGRRSVFVIAGSLVTAVALLPLATQLSGEAQAGAFFGAGALVLTATLTAIRRRLDRSVSLTTRPGSGAAMHLAMRAAARNPLRSTLTIGLVASASFLIVAISAFQLNVSESGSGGFDLLATSSAPIYHDLGDEDGRFELGVGNKAEKVLAQATVRSLRVEAGDDASCLNLFRPRRPQVLGVPSSMASDDTFQWGATVDDYDASPWQLLERELPNDEQGRAVVPVVLDQNTAMYSLHLAGVGATFEIENEQGQPIILQVVGLLKNSIFQGSLLIGEAHFERLYPVTSGYRMFLVRSADGDARTARATLETDLRDFGFDATLSSDRLRELMAVQNTYLSTFQTLGGLGLLLGTFGVAVVQLRSVLERRGELALMRAVGYANRRLGSLVMWESVALLLAGLGVGVLAASVVVLPHWLVGGAAVPWVSLLVTLALIVAAGLLASVMSVRATLRAPLLSALRGN